MLPTKTHDVNHALSRQNNGVTSITNQSIRRAIVIGTDEHRVNDEAAAALTTDPMIYQSAGQLVRVLHDADNAGRGIYRPAGPRIDPIPYPALRDRLTAVAQFFHVVDGKSSPAHPPPWCVSGVAERRHWPGMRVLDAIVPFPILRPDGSILATPGYDRASRLFLDWPHAPLPLKHHPTRADAVAAAELLYVVVADFPFKSPVHRAAWLAALLTALARFMFDGPAPLFLVDANVRAAGKGKLLDVLAMIVQGTRMVIATYPREEDELRKRVTACLMCGDRLVVFDNLTGEFGNGTLDALLTATHWRDRILGHNRMYDGPALATWYATGNNVSIGADTARRICYIRLESNLARPEDRADFRHPDLLAHVQQNRPALLAAAFTIIRAYVQAGLPDMQLRPWGSYEAWSGIVRNALVWIGEPDPGDTRLMVQEQADHTAASMCSLLAALEMIDPERVGLTSAEIVKRAYAEPSTKPDDVMQMLRESIDGLIAKPDSRQLGFKLRANKRRIFEGRFLDTVGTSGGSNRWAAFPANEFHGERQSSHSSHHHPTTEEGDGEIGETFGTAAARGDGEVGDISHTPGTSPFDQQLPPGECPAWKL